MIDLPPLDDAEWALAAALNDLLQVTNHHLEGPFTRRRGARLLANIGWLCGRIVLPRDPESALARHATFGRVLEIARTDSTVSWWTGSKHFRGERPPSRLLAWRELRRVRVEERRVGIGEMAQGMSTVWPDVYSDVLSLWLSRSPLTDLATVGRGRPRFRWSASTLALVACGLGRRLAFRAIVRGRLDDVAVNLRMATAAVPKELTEARELAEDFTTEVANGLSAMGGASIAAARLPNSRENLSGATPRRDGCAHVLRACRWARWGGPHPAADLLDRNAAGAQLSADGLGAVLGELEVCPLAALVVGEAIEQDALLPIVVALDEPRHAVQIGETLGVAGRCPS